IARSLSALPLIVFMVATVCFMIEFFQCRPRRRIFLSVLCLDFAAACHIGTPVVVARLPCVLRTAAIWVLIEASIAKISIDVLLTESLRVPCCPVLLRLFAHRFFPWLLRDGFGAKLDAQRNHRIFPARRTR
ncbi:hypothetical protein, partial [Burkholderia ambifaria]|uniref:hypothetical protein n=1 Tax=Burkholderia ambifaria TaxID=152480 RepID=UPI001ABAED98